MHDHKPRKGPRVPEVAAAIEAEASPETPAGQPIPVKSPRIVRSRRYRVKPLSPEDAALDLDANHEDLLVFRNAETEEVNVIYRQKDGNFGLVEPET